MEEIAENKLFEHNLEASVCTQPVRPVQQTGLHGTVTTWRRATGQTGGQDRSDRFPTEMNFQV